VVLVLHPNNFLTHTAKPHGAEARFRGLGATDWEKTARNICREGGARSSRPDDRKSEDSKRSGGGFRLREDSATKAVKRSADRLEECGSGTQPTDGKCSGFRLIGEARPPKPAAAARTIQQGPLKNWIKLNTVWTCIKLGIRGEKFQYWSSKIFT
jgi:hypothetical protein